MVKLDTETGVIGTIGSFTLGVLPEFTEVEKVEIIFWFQLLAFTVTIIVGFMTTLNILVKVKDRLKKKK